MRYSVNKIPDKTERMQYDVLIVGAGIAGLYTALHIDERYSCCILAKEEIDTSNSWLAQGGIAAAISVDDKPVYHYEDTLVAGAGLCDKEAVKVLVSEGPAEVKKLVEMKVPFDLNGDGELDITREGGHHRRRIVHAGGDATGRETVKALAQLVSLRSNVTFMPHSFFADIITDETGEVTGGAVIDDQDTLRIIETPNIVIATGGVGQVYKVSTNPSVATGDGLAASARAGAKLNGMEFIQFHPTGLWSQGEENRAFLISESVRGEGGMLKNSDGVRFMLGRHDLAELAPRDIVAREITREMKKSGVDHVFVDISSKNKDYLKNRFPTIYDECKSRGINISKEPIPVCPVQHYLIGGIKTDLLARTTVKGLYACGEAASTGVHGANRLASNSMLECLVFGKRAADDINARLAGMVERKKTNLPNLRPRETKEYDYSALRKEIQNIMNEYGFVVRSRDGMETALMRITEIKDELSNSYYNCKDYYETLNVTTVAVEILEAAYARKKSVGSHYREN